MLASVGLAATTDTRTFSAGWADPMNLTLTASLYLTPITVASAATTTVLLHRSGVADLARSTSRGVGRAMLLTVTATWLWSLVSLLAFGVAALLGNSSLSPGPSVPIMLLPLQAILLITAGASIGLTVGRLAPSAISPPTACGATFLLLYVLAISDSRFSPVYPSIFYQIYLEPNTSLLAPILVTLASIAAATATAALTPNRLLIAALFSVVLMSLGWWSVVDAKPVQVRTLQSPAACAHEDTVRLCVWPQSRDRLEPSLKALLAIREAAGNVLVTPSDYAEVGVQHSTAAGAYAVPRQGQAGYIDAAVTAVLPSPACDNPKNLDALFELQGWLLERLDPGSVPAATTIAKADLPTQQVWVSQHITSVLSECPGTR